MENITTILFDIDGTLLDTGDFIIKATEHALAELGYEVPSREVISSHVGRSDYYASLIGSPDNTDKLFEKHRAFQINNYHLAKAYPNTLETLATLKEKGYKLGAVSTRSNPTLHQTLIDADIFVLFDTIVSGKDVKERKPHPEPLLLALKNMNEAADRAVMIGDSYLDVEAGKNAGTKTIRVTYGFHKNNLHNPEPDMIIDDIGELLNIL